MALAVEIAKLADMHAAGSLTDIEFEVARAKLIELDALYRLDYEWEQESQTYTVRSGKLGHLPTTIGAIAIGVLGSTAAIVFLCLAHKNGAPLGSIGMLLLIACIYAATSQYTQARTYEIAKRNYLDRRARILQGNLEGTSDKVQKR